MDDVINRDESGRFIEGNSANPGGRPKDALSRRTIDSVFNALYKLSLDEVRAIAKDPKTNIVMSMIAQTMVKAALEGDSHRITSLLDRAIGKVKDVQDLNINNELDKEVDMISSDKIKTILRKAV